MPETPLPPGASAAGPAVEVLARRALGWSFLNTLVARAGTLLTGIVLARLLVPADYGVYAVALVALSAVLSVNELGVSLAVVRWPGDVNRIAPTVVTLTLVSSVLLWALCFLAAPTVCRLLQAPEATNVLRVLTLSVLIDAVTAVPSALMTRDFLQRERLLVDTVGLVVGSGTAIGFAFAGWGAWALVISLLLGNLVNSASILFYAPRIHRPGFDRAIARELLAFGLPLAGASLLIFALLNVDYIIVGSALGPTELGYYLLAFNLAMWPVNLLSAPVRRVSMPAFARLHADRSGGPAAYLHACLLLLLVTMPISLLLAIFAEPAIGLIYGTQWLPSAAALPMLAVLAAVRVFGELTYDFLVALGRSRDNFIVQVLWLVALVPALWVGVRADGIAGAGLAHALVALAIVIPAYVLALRATGVRLSSLIRQLPRPLLGLALLAAVATTSVALLPGRFITLAVGGLLASAVYLAAVYPMRGLLRGAET